MNQKHVVIVGGGFGGINAAKALKDAPVRVTLVDRRNHHLFQPLLYQVATGSLSPADIASPLRGLLKGQKNTQVLLGEVTGFDVAGRKVLLGEESLDYDALIVAAGSNHHYFGNDQWHSWAPPLKSVEDALLIRRRILYAFETAERTRDPEVIAAALTFVVIGGGPTGVELAGALAEIARETLRHEFHNIDPAHARIILLQAGDRILPTYAPDLSAKAAGALDRLGVTVRTRVRVTAVTEAGVSLLRPDVSEFIPAATVLWAAGVKASPLGAALAQATGADIDRQGRLMVQPDLSLAGHPDVFVIGDLAALRRPDGEFLPGVAQVAIQQGRYVGQLLQRRWRGQSAPPFRYRDRGNMATIGRNAAVAELGRLHLAGGLAWRIWLLVHLLYLTETENRLLVALQWLWNYVTHGRSARLITESIQPQERLPLPAGADAQTRAG
jgi:NADH:ubiquinone reductase (H+-translocating)